jgi:hypothetical protein
MCILHIITNTYKLDWDSKTNKINLSAAFGSPSDNEINKNKLFFLSTTSSKSDMDTLPHYLKKYG